MNATIYSHNIIIGTADLQVGDESMGCVFGQFLPNEYYFNNIQKKVWDFWANIKPDYIKWYSLRFNVKLDNGFFLFPCGGYTIDDIPELPNEPKRIDIGGINLDIFKLKTNSLLEPWSELTIEQKISFEDELNREITPNKSIFDFLSSKDNHILVGAQISAFAKYGPNDDVLFEVIKDGEDNRLAVVHLTWISRKKEHLNHFPTTHFHLDFNDFEEKRMKPDNLEWNA
jgi:hypothetical protein